MYPALNITNDTLHCGNMGHCIHNFEEMCQLAHAYGFDGVNLDLQASDMPEVHECRRLLQTYNLKASAFGFTVKLFESERLFRESLETFELQAQVAHALGCQVALCYLPPFSDHLNFYEMFVQTSDRLRAGKSILERYNIRIGFEFIGPTETRRTAQYDFIHTIDGTRALIASAGLFGYGGFKLDIHHWQNSGAGVLDLQHLDIQDILYVELNDGLPGYDIFTMPEFERELPLTTYVSDIQNFLEVLYQKGYQGPIVIEPWNQTIKAMPVEKAVATVKKSLDKCFGFLKHKTRQTSLSPIL